MSKLGKLTEATEKAKEILKGCTAGISYTDRATGSTMVYGKKKLSKKVNWRLEFPIRAINVAVFDKSDTILWSSLFERCLNTDDQLTVDLGAAAINLDGYIFIMGELVESELVQKTLF